MNAQQPWPAFDMRTSVPMSTYRRDLLADRIRPEYLAVPPRSHASGPTPRPIFHNFTRHVATDLTSDCWLWMGAKAATGIGKFTTYVHLGGTARRTVQAHQMMWEMLNGPLPAGAYISHRCGRPNCVKPEHLLCLQPTVVPASVKPLALALWTHLLSECRQRLKRLMKQEVVA